MSSDDNNDVTQNSAAGKKTQRSEQSKKAEKYLKKQNDSGKGKYVLFGVVALVVVAILGGAVFVATQSSDTNTTVVSGELPPFATAENPGWVSNSDLLSGPPTGSIEVFSDFQCPACQLFSEAYETVLQEFAAANNVELVYLPMTFKDASSRNDSSAQATNAFACAIDEGAGREYYSAVFQTPPTGAGWTQKQIKQFGEEAGLTGDGLKNFNKCVDEEKYLGWGSAVNQFSANAGVNSTPTVTVNGVEIPRENFGTESELIQAIQNQLG